MLETMGQCMDGSCFRPLSESGGGTWVRAGMSFHAWRGLLRHILYAVKGIAPDIYEALIGLSGVQNRTMALQWLANVLYSI